jgi:hypothetical protein
VFAVSLESTSDPFTPRFLTSFNISKTRSWENPQEYYRSVIDHGVKSICWIRHTRLIKSLPSNLSRAPSSCDTCNFQAYCWLVLISEVWGNAQRWTSCDKTPTGIDLGGCNSKLLFRTRPKSIIPSGLFSPNQSISHDDFSKSVLWIYSLFWQVWRAVPFLLHWCLPSK